MCSEEATSASAGFHSGPLAILIDLELGNVGFCEGRKTEYLKKLELNSNSNHIRYQAEVKPSHISGR